MKIAVFSDVQGNLPAMETAVEHILAWAPDLVLMNGDLVNRGPRSRDCLLLFDELAQNQGWLPIRGNHEDYVLHCAEHAPQTELERELRRFADWTVEQLGVHRELMRNWPEHLCLQGPNDSWVHLTHGSLLGNRDGISRSVSDEQLQEKIPEHADLFVVAHTHKPLQRTFGQTRILNVGSVGSPFDGDVRASYARLHYCNGTWKTEIVRLDYDRDRAERDFHQSGFLAEGGPLAGFVFEEWRRAELMMPRFNARYMQALKNRDITLQEAVERFLGEI